MKSPKIEWSAPIRRCGLNSTSTLEPVPLPSTLARRCKRLSVTRNRCALSMVTPAVRFEISFMSNEPRTGMPAWMKMSNGSRRVFTLAEISAVSFLVASTNLNALMSTATLAPSRSSVASTRCAAAAAPGGAKSITARDRLGHDVRDDTDDEAEELGEPLLLVRIHLEPNAERRVLNRIAGRRRRGPS